uniref:Uncharacterized protein n=1 Tax=Panagrellus redivivus TaxID=6233 RepID=A0A7E4ZQ79_PANRE
MEEEEEIDLQNGPLAPAVDAIEPPPPNRIPLTSGRCCATGVTMGQNPSPTPCIKVSVQVVVTQRMPPIDSPEARHHPPIR